MRIHNSLTRTKEDFVPLTPGKVGMYVCGPTVYDFAHIGNARPVIVFDTLYRVLSHLYDEVLYVRNITDVDDKINKRAKDSGEDIRTITERTAQAYHEDMAALNALPPGVEPRATEHIPEMITLIEGLIEKGHAYAAEGHVLFNVPSMPNYGGLSNRSRDDLVAGARVEVAPYKKDAADFVLWKPSDDETPGWESPWGRGRPGWHIECSAMSWKYLGETFDIHGGGHDLVFPHHENEIAQSCCAHGTDEYARYWMHNGHLMVEGEKMSKSLGNFFTVRDLLEKAPGEALRFYMLQTHYRQPLDWTQDGLEAAKSALDRFYTALRLTAEIDAIESEPDQKVLEALQDDLNTPLAISRLHELLGNLNKASSPQEIAEYKGKLLVSAKLLGVLLEEPEAWFRWRNSSGQEGLSDQAIEGMIEARADARKNKNFAEADRIRDELTQQGIILEDAAGKTTWKRS